MRAFHRTSAFFSTWSGEFLRQPGLMLTLVIGPFLILLAFGQGVDIGVVRPQVIVVQPEGDAQEMQPLPEELEEHVEVVGTTHDLAAARERLREGDVDGVAVIPADPEGIIRGGEHVPLRILTSEIDPLQRTLARGYLDAQVAALNQRMIAEAISDVQGSVGEIQGQVATAREYVALARDARDDIEDARDWVTRLEEMLGPIQGAADTFDRALSGIPFIIPGWGDPEERINELQTALDDLAATVNALDERLNEGSGNELPTDAELASIDEDLARVEEIGAELQDVPPEVLSAPFELEFDNVAPFVPDFGGFYAPAVLALLLQHLGVSLAALSATRLRHAGLLDVLRVSPARPVEVVNGNYLAFGVVVLAAAAGVLALMMLGLSVPVHGSWVALAATLGLLVAVSLGIGFVIALVSSTEKGAAQLAMLVLLASVFFSGLVIALDRVEWPVRAISYALPSTYAIRAFQDIMLRGILRHPIDLVVLGVAAVALYALTVTLFRRDFRSS